MFLKYRNYSHDAGETTIAISREGLFTENQVRYATRERWDISGRIQITDQGTEAANQTLMTTTLDALEAAYATGGGDIGLYQDSGAVTTHFLDSSATRGGTRIVQPVSYPDGRGAEYSTFRNYTVAIEGTTLDSSGALVFWTETLQFFGGGPQVGFLPCLTGPPQKQLLYQATTYKAMQTGRAIGLGTYPATPAPLWPSDEHLHVKSNSKQLPADQSNQRITTWAYQFESVAPLGGLPTSSQIS